MTTVSWGARASWAASVVKASPARRSRWRSPTSTPRSTAGWSWLAWGRGRSCSIPAGKKLRISATGGRGGQGGPGGTGGQGGEGGDAGVGDNPRPGNGSDGGSGGQGGAGGQGGPGGTFQVQFDQAHPELVGLVVFENPGGEGGAGGQGGAGGRGGKPGTAPDGDRAAPGRTGNKGQSGGRGGAGQPGPRLDPRPADVRQLFAAEIGRGLPIEVSVP